MKTLLLFAILGFAVAKADDKIINGHTCRPHSQPWQMFFTTSGHRWCGGSILNENWVLSAAHCEQPPETLVAHIGEHDKSLEEGTEQRLSVSRVIPHPFYNSRTMDNDIMLVRLASPARLDADARAVPLAGSCPTAGLQCLVSGWGNIMNDGNVFYPDELQCLDIPVIPTGDCLRAYPGLISDNMFCAGYMEGGKDACQGDSGGPVVCGGELQGVVSWGYGCAERNYPGVYTKVCKFNDWIQETMAAN